ncbi:MAG TPA: hypothetical protein VGO93_08315 [Candidatus Xenobia bacterium]
MDRTAADLARRGLAPLAIAVLESARPLSFVASQFLVGLDPVVRLFADVPGYARLVSLLEDRDRMEALVVALERAIE